MIGVFTHLSRIPRLTFSLIVPVVKSILFTNRPRFASFVRNAEPTVN